MKTRFSHAAAFGAASAMGVIALSLLIYALDLNDGTNYLSYVVVIGVACFGVKKWREQEGGYLTFGGAYKHLLLQSLVYTLIMSVWIFVFVTYVAPGLFESKLLEIEMKLEEQGQPQEVIDMTMKWTRMMMTPGAMVIWTLLGFGVYAVLDLILAAIMKKDPPPPQFVPPPHDSFSYIASQGDQQNQNSPYQQPPSNFPPQQ